MCPGAQDHILALQPKQLGHPQSRLYRHQEQSLVTTPSPGCLVRGRHQRVDLFLAEVFDQPPFVTLAGDGQNTTALLRVAWFLEGDVVEEGMEGWQPGGPTPGAVPPFLLQVIQEVADEGSIQFFER